MLEFFSNIWVQNQVLILENNMYASLEKCAKKLL